MKTRLKVTSFAFLTRLPVHISACSRVNYRSIDTNLPADGRCSRNEKASVGPSSCFPGSDLEGRLLAASPAIAVDLRALLPLLPCEDPSMPCAPNAACKKKKIPGGSLNQAAVFSPLARDLLCGMRKQTLKCAADWQPVAGARQACTRRNREEKMFQSFPCSVESNVNIWVWAVFMYVMTRKKKWHASVVFLCFTP